MRIYSEAGPCTTAQHHLAIRYQQRKSNLFVNKLFRNRVTAAIVSDDNRFLAVGTQNGEVCILNFLSGGLLYTLPSQDKEITQLMFLLGRKSAFLK